MVQPYLEFLSYPPDYPKTYIDISTEEGKAKLDREAKAYFEEHNADTERMSLWQAPPAYHLAGYRSPLKNEAYLSWQSSLKDSKRNQ